MLVQLLEAAVRSFVLGGAVWLSLWLLRVQNPQVRMTAWTVVLIAALSMPVVMHWVTVPIPANSPPPDVAIARQSATITPPAWRTEFPPKEMGSQSATESTGSAGGHPQEPFSGAPVAVIDWQVLTTGVYLLVVGVLLLRLVIGLALTWRVLRKSRRIDEDWTVGLDVRLSAAVATPVTFGATILLPAECLDWSPTKRQAVLTHEKSHVAHGDFYVLLLATMHRAVFWFSPFSWWLLDELAETAERISDDAAIATVGDRTSYAEILLEVASSARQVSAGIAMARTRSALKRVERILAVAAPPPPRLGRGRRALVALSLAPLVAMTTVSLSKETRPSGMFQPRELQLAPRLWIAGGLNISAERRLHVNADQYRLLDAGNMFNRDADWKTVASHASAVQMPGGVVLDATDDDLRHAFQNLAERHIALALEFRVLVRTERCPQKTKGYSTPGALEEILERTHRLGGDLKYLVMDDPFFFGHRFAGRGACFEPPEKLARQVAEKIRLARGYFPNVQVGTSDVVDESAPWIDELVEWTDVYQRITGEPLAFFHANVAWSDLAMRNLAPLASALKARHIPFGIIYNADDAAHSDEAWADNTRQHIARIESTLGIRPYAAIFRSWTPYPSRLLPETQPGTLTNLALQYLLARPSVTLTRRSNILSGQMVDAQGHPVASADLTVDALDVAARMAVVERHLTGKVPPYAASALVGIHVDHSGACVCAGRAVASVGPIRYREPSTSQHEEIPPFPATVSGSARPAIRVMQLVPGEPATFNLKWFPVTAGADYALDVPLAVSANGERAGYVALTFFDGDGRAMRLDRLWFRPSVYSLGHAVTDAEGRFQVEIPSRVVEAGSEIRAYFPGSASLGSQTVTASTH